MEGRIWIATDYVTKDSLGNLALEKKPLGFIQWYEKIAKWIKKKYIKSGKGFGGAYCKKGCN